MLYFLCYLIKNYVDMKMYGLFLIFLFFEGGVSEFVISLMIGDLVNII